VLYAWNVSVALMRDRPASGKPAASPLRSDDLPAAVRTALTRVAVGDGLSPVAFAEAFEASAGLRPPVRDVVLGSLMTAVMTRGPVVEDVVELLGGALRVDARSPAQKISGGEHPVIVLAGSGKKGFRTLNVSTPAALVAAAAGAKVIKVGSAATSSALGSRDLVRALDLPERRTAEDVRADLAACGFSFVAVEPEIPVLDRLYGGRFHAPNPFSFGLAPLASPVRGDLVVFGLSHPRVDVAAHVLRRFGMTEVDVLTTRLPSGHYLDEIGPAGELRWCRVRDGEVRPVQAEAAQNWATTATPFELPMPCGPEEAIERTGDLLAGGGMESHRVVVSINAAHLLVLSGLAASQSDGIAIAEDILRGGDVLATVAGACAVNRSA
jgi:anthranilate phosphoribosyltransferase